MIRTVDNISLSFRIPASDDLCLIQKLRNRRAIPATFNVADRTNMAQTKASKAEIISSRIRCGLSAYIQNDFFYQ